jgi:hypothetical protein
LAEAALGSPLTVRDFEEFVTAARLSFLALPGKAVVVCDMTRLTVFGDDIAERAVDLVRRDNPKVERGAYLVPQRWGATSMQVSRLFREAGSETRQLFDEKSALRAFLGPALTPAELARLDEVLAGIPAGGSH